MKTPGSNKDTSKKRVPDVRITVMKTSLMVESKGFEFIGSKEHPYARKILSIINTR